MNVGEEKTKGFSIKRAENLSPFYLALTVYFFLCRLALLRFLRLWVATLCLFLFLPLGIGFSFVLITLFHLYIALNALYKHLCRFECRNIVRRNLYRGVL